MAGLSFEYFPPRSAKAARRLRATHAKLAKHGPSYVSVTFGAGGSTCEGTRDTLADLKGRGATTAAHLCYSGVPGRDVLEYADDLWAAGHRRIVALRGDAEPCGGEGFADVAEFVAALRERRPFDVAVSCYPEVHPRAASPESDMDVLLAKQAAGASHAISQFFFDADTFLAFERRARAAGVTIPIVPGILPIYDIERAIELGDKCGSTVPQWVRDEYLTAMRNGTDTMAVSRDLIGRQVRDLRDAGVTDVHLYTLNRAELSDIAAREFLHGETLARAA